NDAVANPPDPNATLPAVMILGYRLGFRIGHVDDVVLVDEDTCACRKPKSGRIADAARQPGRATRCVRFAEPGERPAHPDPMTGAFSPYCNSEHTLARSDADAPRPARRCGPRTRDGSFRSNARQTNSATASPLQWVCRGCPWLVSGV